VERDRQGTASGKLDDRVSEPADSTAPKNATKKLDEQTTLDEPTTRDEPKASTDPDTGPQSVRAPVLPAPRQPTDLGRGPDEQTNVPRLADRVAELERQVRQLELLVRGRDGEDLPELDLSELDLSDPELVNLAKAADHTETLTRMLVSPPVREACEQAIQAHLDSQLRYEHARDAALAASRTLATTRTDQDRHREAAKEFAAARAELRTLLPERQRIANAADHARRQLAHDREIRDRYGPEIAEGHRAWGALTSRLRLRISAALERGEPLPRWLVDALGRPPNGDPSAWRELAVQLSAYRLSYTVSDPRHPLGPRPTTRDSPRRRRWYGELDRQLAAWRAPRS
jgi:hypothetical protein